MADPLPTEAPMSSQLMTPLYASAAMRSAMSDQARLQRMLDFEAALARAEAAVGVVPAGHVAEIADACKAEKYSIALLMEASVPSGNIAMAVVDALTNEVARRNPAAANFVHWGATGQDVVDTALVLELRAAIDALLVDLDIAIKGFVTLAGRHRRTLSVARTAMQHALPMPFGLRLAGYAAALGRSRERLTRLRREGLPLQFGGAAGTLAALGEHGFGVAERLAALLDLQLPDAPWHSHRDRLAEIASCLAILAGTCGKIARDVALMMQIEISEAFEPSGSDRRAATLPHQRGSIGAVAALSAATIAPNLVATLLAAQVQEHERGLGGWPNEWTTFPTLALVTSGALDAVVNIAEGLEIDIERLKANLDLSGGQIMSEAVAFALAEKIGRAEAHKLMQELSQKADKEERPLKDVLQGDIRVKAHLGHLEVEKLFIPLTYQGSAQTFIDRLVVASQTRAPRREQRSDVTAEPRPERAEIRMVEPRLPTAPQLAQSAEPQQPAKDPQVDEPPVETLPAPPATAAGAPKAALDTAMDTPVTPELRATPADLDPASNRIVPTPELKPSPPDDEDAPGALMDVLSRADAEAASRERKS